MAENTIIQKQKDKKVDSETKAEIVAMKEDIDEMKKELKTLPDEISARVDKTMELKIQVAVKDIEMRFYKWLTGITIGLLVTAAGLIYELIKN